MAILRTAGQAGLACACLGLVACTPLPVAPAVIQPAPYRSPCLESALLTEQHAVRGYGSGTSLRAARLEALQDMAERVRVQVTGETRQRLMRDIQGRIEHSLSNTVEARSSEVFSEVELACLDERGDPAGHWHVGVRADLRDPAAIVAERVQGRGAWRGPAALLQGPFWQRVVSLRPAERSQGTISRLSVRRQGGGWQLLADGEPLYGNPLPLSAVLRWQALGHAWPMALEGERGTEGGARVRSGADVRLRVEPPGPGFVSLLHVGADERLTWLRRNVPVSGAVLVWPPRGAFSLSLPAGEASAEEVFVAVWSPESLAHPPEFSPDDAYGLSSLLEWLESPPHQSTVLPVLVLP